MKNLLKTLVFGMVLLAVSTAGANEPARIAVPDSTSPQIPMPRPVATEAATAPATAAKPMILPEIRPDLADIYPETPVDFVAGFARLAGLTPRSRPVTLGLKSGEGLASMLTRGGLEAEAVHDAIALIAEHISPRSLPVGFEVEFIPGGDSRPAFLGRGDKHGAGLRMEIPDDMTLTLAQVRTGAQVRAKADGSAWRSEVSRRPVEYTREYVSGKIENSLYKSGIGAGMNDAVIDSFVGVLGFSIDFQREIRRHDEFAVLFETAHDPISGKTRHAARLDYISMVLSGTRIEYFRHRHQDGTTGWYDPDGKSAVRTLMRTPINGARLSSGYGNRRHPILGYNRMHRGADFAAPTGTPIMAAGSGVVEAAGRNGNYGKYVRIRHSKSHKTAYAHLSRINVSRGTRVSQGDIIGRVGSTGLSTGPHLHYEIIVNNRKVNPLTVRLPSGKPLPENETAHFARTIAAITAEIAARGQIASAQ